MTKHKIEREAPKEWQIPENMPKPPDHRYGAAIIDSPWEVDQRGKTRRAAESVYDLMKVDAIKALPIGDIMKPDSFVFAWFTPGALPYVDDVIKAWGYRPASIMTWVKEAGGRLGLGNIVRHNAEFIRIGVRGNAKVKFRSQPSVFYAPTQDHSHKPEEFHQIVRRLVGDEMEPFCEIFARRPYPGWDVAGNEVPSDFTLPGLETPVLTQKAFEHQKEE